ncbi:MAG: hypothetical protein OEX02_07370 [Cyclobacteriaceae bacterium]|nr:hypothetical protein [Cyclobacteriaceae bacterium]
MKPFVFFFLGFLTAFSGYGQVSGEINGDTPFKDRLYLGGGMDFAIDDYRFLIGASPSLGVMMTNSTSVGTGMTYQYYKLRLYNEQTNVYGYRFFLRQNIFRQIFAYTEYENLSYKSDIFNTNSPRIWDSAMYIGGGYYTPINERAGFLMLALYDLLHKPQEYGSPLSFRAGLTYSFF